MAKAGQLGFRRRADENRFRCATARIARETFKVCKQLEARHCRQYSRSLLSAAVQHVRLLLLLLLLLQCSVHQNIGVHGLPRRDVAAAVRLNL